MARYGLVVGVAKYKSPLGYLSKTESDAKAVKDLLNQHGNFDNIQVLLGDVTKKQLEDALELLLLKQADLNEALIYFSGHAVEVKGSFGKKRGYLALSNTGLKTSNGEITEVENGIALDDLSVLIGEAKLSNLVVLLDCCHSETLLEESQGFLQRAIVSQAFAELKQDYFLVSACRKFEEAYAMRSETHSIFTGAMLRGLARERANERGRVDASTMFGYVAEELRNTGQEAVSFGYGRAISIVHYHPNERQTTSVLPLHSPNFVGRDGVLTELDRLFEQNRLILIQGEGGLGKSTVANFYCQRFEFNDFHRLSTVGSSDIANAESLVDKWLHEFFSEEGGVQDFSIKLSRLRKHLQNDNRKICFVLDNLEPALANGRFKEENNRYVDLLQVLSDPCVRSITLITSRERIYENGINVYTYYLPELAAIDWYEYFQNYQIQVSEESLENPNSTLNLMHKAYGGNAECMFVLRGDISRAEYDNNLEIYWAAHRENLSASDTIESLIKRQFEMLQKDNQLAYKFANSRMKCNSI